jgi:tRNA(fMet)-specific endonuclease VapC
MGFLIDASVFIAAERGRLRLEPWLAEYGDEPAALSVITAAELLHGVERAADPGVRQRRERFVEAIVGRFPLVEFGLEAARVYARLWAELAARGQMVGVHDLMVGATAISLGFGVATTDARDFGRIPGLKVLPVPG